MSDVTGSYSLHEGDGGASSLLYLNVADRLRLMAAGAESAEVEKQLEQIADTYEKLLSLCLRFKNLKPKISIRGPILPD